MSNLMRVLTFFGWVFFAYVFAFVLCFMLYMGCTQDGHSAGECKSNTLTTVVTYPLRPFFK